MAGRPDRGDPWSGFGTAWGPDRGDPWSGFGTAWAVMGTLAAGIVAWGGIGYLVDRLIGLRWLFLPIGMVMGAGTAIYLVYVRYGGDHGKT